MARYYFYKATVSSGNNVIMKPHGIINTDDYNTVYKDPVLFLDKIILNEVHRLMDEIDHDSLANLAEDFDVTNYEVTIDTINRI